MTISSLNIPQPSDEPYKQAPIKVFGDMVVKNHHPHLTLKPTICELLLVCECRLSSVAAFAHPLAKDTRQGDTSTAGRVSRETNLFLSTNQYPTYMRRITMIASLWMLCCAMVFSCSGGKKANAPQENQPMSEAPAAPEATAPADDDPNAIPDEVVDVANACSYYDNDRTLTANDFTLIARYNDAGRHCAYYTQKDNELMLYQYNLESRRVRVIDLSKTDITPKKEGRTETTPSLFEVSQIVVKGDRFYIIGSNNANGPWYEVYLISYNTIDEEFVCLDYGVDIRLINDNRQAVVTHAKLIKLGEVYADSEVKTWDVTVNLP